MANEKISAFAAASALTGTEELGGVQSAANAKITPAQIKTYCNTMVALGTPVMYPSLSIGTIAATDVSLATLQTQNAAGLKCAMIGVLNIQGVAAGATKTLSSAGGKIYFRTGAVTFANAGTTIDVGIQGLSTAAGPVVRPDDTFVVKKTLTGGTDTITTNGETTATMSTGTVSLTNGAYVCVVIDMTARGGADSVAISRGPGSGAVMPCLQLFSAAAWATSVTVGTPIVRIEFDDGTLGYIENGQSVTAAAAEAWADATNPDERGNIMQFPFGFVSDGMWIVGGVTDSSSTFTYNVFSDPTGTPAGLSGASGTYSPRNYTAAGGATERLIILPFSSDVTISKNTDYALAIRATGSSNSRLGSWTVSAAANKTWFGNGTAGKTTRDGGTGAFAAKSATIGYYMGLMVKKVIA